MKRVPLRASIGRILSARKESVRRGRRHFRPGADVGIELLECRRLLASITPSGVFTSTPNGANFDYTITVTNSSSSTSPIGTFWYAWIPGYDYLATTPISVTPPTGWTKTVTHGGPSDGYGIEFV